MDPNQGYFCDSVVEMLLKAGADVNALNKVGCTPLMGVALFWGERPLSGTRIGNILLEAGADADLRGEGQKTTLFLLAQTSAWASHQNPLEGANFARTLIEKYGAEVDALNKANQTPLHAGLTAGTNEIVKVILEAKATPNLADEDKQTAMHKFAQSTTFHADNSVADLLKLHGWDVDYQDKLGDTPLHYVSDETRAVWFINNEAVPNLQNEEGETALHAVLSRSIFSVGVLAKVLLEAGWHVDAQDKALRQPLHVAAWNRGVNRADLVQMLLNHSADASVRTAAELTPLHRVRMGEVVKVLVQQGKADIEAEDQNKQHPLHTVTDVDATIQLLEASAKVDPLDKDHCTPLHRAAALPADKPDARPIVRHLLLSNANHQLLDKDGKTPLHYANQASIVKVLFEFGAHLDAIDQNKRTPIVWTVCAAADLTPDSQEVYTAFDVITELAVSGADLSLVDKDSRTVFHHLARWKDTRLAWHLFDRLLPTQQQGWFTPGPSAGLGREDKAGHLFTEIAIMNCFKLKDLGALVGMLQLFWQKRVIAFGRNAYEVDGNKNWELIINNIKVTDAAGDSLLHKWARTSGMAWSFSIFDTIIKRAGPAVLDLRNKEKQTALFVAVHRKNFDAAKALVTGKADVSLSDNRFETPLFYAATPQLTHLLVDSVQDVSGLLDQENKMGRTALMVALTQKRYDVARALLGRGAKLANKANKSASDFVQGSEPAGVAMRELLAKIQSGHWNRLHVAVDSCDVHAAIVAVAHDKSLMAGSKAGQDRENPLELARKHQKECNLLWVLMQSTMAMLTAEQEAQARLEVLTVNDKKDAVVGVVVAILAIGSLAIHILLLHFNTLRSRMILRKLLPMAVLGGASGVVWYVTQDRKWNVALSGRIGVFGSIGIAVVLLLACPGGQVERRLGQLKRLGGRVRDRFWEIVELTLNSAMCITTIIGEIRAVVSDGMVMLAVLVQLISSLLIYSEQIKCSYILHRLLRFAGTGVLLLATVFRIGKPEASFSPALLLIAALALATSAVEIKSSVKEGIRFIELELGKAQTRPKCELWLIWTDSGRVDGKLFEDLEVAVNAFESKRSQVDAVVLVDPEFQFHRKEGRVDPRREKIFRDWLSAKTKVQDERFVVGKLILGHPARAAHGLEHALGLSSLAVVEGVAKGILAMEEEVIAHGSAEDIENFRYIAYGVSGNEEDFPGSVVKALESGTYHGGHLARDDFDAGHDGRTLDDWMQVPEVKLAALSQAEFVAVRFYTSSSFRKINGPLREMVARHPWAMVVYFLASGIKKLRSVQAQVAPEMFASTTVLWRGMKNLHLDIDAFRRHGGTELGCMSTTTKEEVAKRYATSAAPLVFKYEVVGLRAGVSIQFLSLYPKEKEYIYPPLTYLTLRTSYEDDGINVVVVEPVMS